MVSDQLGGTRGSSISVVAPMLDEEDNIDAFLERTEGVLGALGLAYEIICVNDGSGDGTAARLAGAHARDPRIKVIQLSRNFGKDYALSAGLDRATGDAVVTIDADLQHPPEVIGDLVAKWREGHDIVYAVRTDRSGDPLPRRLSAWLFYRLFNAMVDVSIPRGGGDFQLLDRKVADVLRRIPERNRFMKGLCAWVGFSNATVAFRVGKRFRGESRWRYRDLFRFSLDGVTAFSTLPLRMWAYFGLVIAVAALVFGAFQIARTMVLGVDVPGYASIMVSVLFIGGVQLITLGILGEYVGRTYHESKGRPLYVVEHELGFEERVQPGAARGEAGPAPHRLVNALMEEKPRDSLSP